MIGYIGILLWFAKGLRKKRGSGFRVFCPHCGGSVSDDASFCPYCGGRLTRVVAQPPLTPPSRTPARQAPPTDISYLESAPRKKGFNWGALCCGVLIIIIVVGSIGAIMVLSWLPSWFPDGWDFGEPRKIGSENYSVPMNNATPIVGVDLVFIVEVGAVIIGTGTDLMSTHVEITQEVWTTNDSITYNSLLTPKFQNTTAGNITTVTFSSVSGPDDYWYVIHVTLHPGLALGLDMDLSTAAFNFTTTRDIVLRPLNININTGAILIELGGITTLNFTQGNLTTLTGAISLSSSNWNMTNNCTLNLITNTGAISINQTQTIAFSHTLRLEAEANTGAISAEYFYGTNVGVKVDASSDVGPVSVNGVTSGVTPNYGTALTHLDTYFHTSTGAVDVDVVAV